METTFKDEAVVLRKSYSGEKDLSITVYLKKYGKENIYIPFGQIIKNPIVTISEPFNWFKGIFIKRRGKVFIQEIDNFKNLSFQIAQDLKKFETAFFISKYFNKYVISPDEKYFIFLKKNIYYLIQAKKTGNFKLNFLIKFIFLSGIFPNLENCSICSVKINKSNFGNLSISNSGVICKNCLNKKSFKDNELKFSFEELKILNKLKNIPFKDLDKINIPESTKRKIHNFSLDYIYKYL
jgi:DNA repair protein RecO (recombination protein O)